MRRLSMAARKAVMDKDDRWVEQAEELVRGLQTRGAENKVGQLRNIQSLAESTNSWKAVQLFMRYQAARKQLDADWVEAAIKRLDNLLVDAKTISQLTKDDETAVHMELLERVIGFAVRKHVWDTRLKGKEEAV
jgi:hypothetical protein